MSPADSIPDPSLRDELVALGLTALEADIYLQLLEAPGSTGYGVAKAIGKPTANTYKALDSLRDKGGIVREEAGRRQFTAVAPEEFLGGLGRRLAARIERTTARLATRAAPRRDDRVYALRTPAQVLERLRGMIAASGAVVLIDAFPWGLAALGSALEEAAARGVRVAVKAYEPASLDGVDVVVDPAATITRGRWDGEWLNGTVDGEQIVLAWLSPRGDRVRQAIWSGSSFLAWTWHGGLVHEIVDARLEHDLALGHDAHAALAAARALARRLLDDVPGADALRRRTSTPFGA